ncbi:Histone deacetylase 8 [Blyttiomyces sp. JEL0837]|nr:Histone deacetylase 8 [Blyttiomyces sp. JEL0837]
MIDHQDALPAIIPTRAKKRHNDGQDDDNEDHKQEPTVNDDEVYGQNNNTAQFVEPCAKRPKYGSTLIESETPFDQQHHTTNIITTISTAITSIVPSTVTATTISELSQPSVTTSTSVSITSNENETKPVINDALDISKEDDTKEPVEEMIADDNGTGNLESVPVTEAVESIPKATRIPLKSFSRSNVNQKQKLNVIKRIVEPKRATRKDLTSFHAEDYVDMLFEAEALMKLDPEAHSEALEDYGLQFLSDYVQLVTGASITAATELISGSADVAINWDGGRHHGQSDRAAGFCYMNDVVISILLLHEKFPKVLYIDVDIHHCDGVESAFRYSTKVMRVSFHLKEPGFFPGTGSPTDHGKGKGANHALNVALPRGTEPQSFLEKFKEVMDTVMTSYVPDAVVLQLGTDGAYKDPLVAGLGVDGCSESGGGGGIGGWNLNAMTYGDRVPLLLLGGGGYRSSTAARAWSFCTMVACGMDDGVCEETDVPEHEFFESYGPDFVMGWGRSSSCLVK